MRLLKPHAGPKHHYWFVVLYKQNRNIYPESVTDMKRMINNYVPKFVPNSSNKKKSKKREGDEEPTEKEELFFLQQQNENW